MIKTCKRGHSFSSKQCNECHAINHRNSRLKKRYGITAEQYDKWNAHNNNLCHICNKPEVIKCYRTGKIKMLAVDHDKITGLVRGLLCYSCNVGIGQLRHDITTLNEAVDYLNHFNKITVPGVQSAANSR